ncbi:ATP-grasp ribosomal peptide maturase [Saccharopolyspora pogona]|uniref:ATP-grasp ribosomal peptide maturase n=1 Tax=Saccharopolyspora pogona TaxID=333966 RepID=UPI00168495CF|nr:ATP-grasp ribosomal peptide maturase [Saccharopolyspora pogona]
MGAASVLVISQDLDITADLVIAELARRDVGVVRFDLADFPEALTQVAYLVPGRTRWTGALRGRVRDVDLSAVESVWYRKPSPFALAPGMTRTEQQWAAAEARVGFGGLLAALDVRWVSRPDLIAVAGYKPLQMAVAVACGLAVPESLVTNDPAQARDFCWAHRKAGVIYKPLTGGPGSENGDRVALRADTVSAGEITDGVRRTTHLFQVRVPCAYAVRVTVVGDRLFAARIDTPPGVDTVDWRAVHDQLTWTPIDVPDDVAAGLRAVMGRLGLAYAAPDFIVDHDGRWQFHGDLNPNGQWAWIESLRPAITRALADELTQGRS